MFENRLSRAVLGGLRSHHDETIEDFHVATEERLITKKAFEHGCEILDSA